VAYESAVQKMKSGDYQSAVSNFRKVIPADSNYPDAQSQLSNAVKLYKDKVFAGLSAYESHKQYENAISEIRAALLTVPDDADFLAKIDEFEQKIADEVALTVDGLIRDAKSKVSDSSDYVGALSDLSSAISKYSDNAALKATLSDVENEYIEMLVGNANNLVIESGDYVTAMDDLRALSRQYSNSAKLKDAISALEDGYVSMMLDEAAKIAGKSEYKEAVELLNDALTLAPNNSMLKSAITSYEAKYPVLLQQVEYFVGRKLVEGGQDKDNLGNTQFNTISASIANTYKLNGEYTKITGSFYLRFEERSQASKNRLEIRGDDKLLYSVVMTAGIEPINFSVDLTGVKDMNIIGDTLGYGHVRLADVLLHK